MANSAYIFKRTGLLKVKRGEPASTVTVSLCTIHVGQEEQLHGIGPGAGQLATVDACHVVSPKLSDESLQPLVIGREGVGTQVHQIVAVGQASTQVASPSVVKFLGRDALQEHASSSGGLRRRRSNTF